MALSTEMIQQVRFSQRKKGYDPAEVDAFLDTLTAEVQESLRQSQEEEARLREEERKLVRALIHAETASQRMIDDANMQAEAILQSAKQAAERIRIKAEAEAFSYRDKCEQECSQLAAEISHMKQLREKYRQSILADMEAMRAEFDQRFMGDPMFDGQILPGLSEKNRKIVLPEEEPQQPCEEAPQPAETWDAPVDWEAPVDWDNPVDNEAALAAEAAEQQRQAEEETPVPQEEGPTGNILTQNGEFDLSAILKDLPESESELKAMIDELL